MSIYIKLILIVFCIICVVIGWIGRGMIENIKKLELNTAMA